MSLLMPAIVGDYFSADKHHDSKAVAQCFAADGVVHDEGRTYAGHAAIQAWKEAGSQQYGATVSPISADTQGASYLSSVRMYAAPASAKSPPSARYGPLR